MDFLTRYMAGEHEQVWNDLLDMGGRVRDPAVLPDALAVARETMRRVRHNIEALIPRLRSAGYEFGYAWLADLAEWEAPHRAPLTPEDLRQMKEMEVSDELLQDIAEHDGEELAWTLDFARQHHPILSPPAPNVHEQLVELERLVGHIPLSVYAWYEQVGAVDFVGRPPNRAWTPRRVTSPEVEREVRRHEHISDVLEYCSDLDPLYIWPIETTMQMADRPHPPDDTSPRSGPGSPQSEASAVISVQGYLPLAPDAYGKYFVSGGGPIGIDLPKSAMDGEFVDNMTFVEYLRLCFRWAGFPGLASYVGPIGTIERDVRILTGGLLTL